MASLHPTPAAPQLVAVGSANRVKVDAARISLTTAFPASAFEAVGFDVPSGVSVQPMGEAETRRGAVNRAVAAAEACLLARGRYPEFAVGMEGGVAEDAPELPTAWRPGQAVVFTPHPQLRCFAHMAVLQCGTGKLGCAQTGTFVVPDEVAALVRGGMELGDADATVFGRANDSKTKDGTVGYLTKGGITRTDYYTHAMQLALVPFTSPEWYAQGGGGAGPPFA